MLVLVPSFELAELIVNLRWNRDRHYLVAWPVCRSQALAGEIDSISLTWVLLRRLYMLLELFSLLLDQAEVLEHTLKLTYLLHPARNLEVGHKEFLVLDIFRLFGQKSSCELVPVHHEEEVLINEIRE